ncbi:MAG: hypothetical protein KatS3mg131_1915 [Candidatus Tectimicrobiota bacterium]|nr:MAG: hypothetical protein KatS3mg131_1915 [Candidatus Tectomicrobia bacterium]
MASGGRLRVRPWLGVLAAVLLLASPGLAVPAVQTVEGVGAIVRRDEAAARRRALEGALREALERVVAELVPPEVQLARRQTLERELFASTLRYIRSYRILWEYPDVGQKVYRMGLEVEVAVADVTARLTALGLTQRQRGRVLLAVREAPGEGGGLAAALPGVVASVLRSALGEQGFEVTAATEALPEARVLQEGQEKGVDFVLLSQAEAHELQSQVAGLALHAVQATATLAVFAAGATQALAREQVETTVLHGDAVLARRQALEKAARQLAARVLPVLQAARQAAESGQDS